MPLSHAFRLSFYCSLGISCLTLFYGEWDFLPWACAVFPLLLAFMAFAYVREGRDYLNEVVANRIGTGIGLMTIAWVVYKVPRTEQDLIAGGVPWPAAMVPLLAPLLPILLMVKLYRPKTLADFWVFQLISLVNVTLACILAGELWFFLLLAVFLASQLWCMTLFFHYRQMVYRDHPDVNPRKFPLFGPKEAVDPTPTPLPVLGLRRALRWATPVLILGLSLFFVMPRFSDSQWVPNKLSAAGQTVLKTGAGGSGIDVAREGAVEMSEEPAFEVQVFNHEGKPGNLPMNQRWRVKVFDSYEHGTWKPWDKPLRFRRQPLPSEEHLLDNWHNPRHPGEPPTHLADSQVYLYFQVESSQASGVPLADPITSGRQVGLYPHFGKNPSKNPFFRLDAEADIYQSKEFKNVAMRYGQILTPSLRGSSVPSLNTISERYLQHLLAPFVTVNKETPKAIQKWTRQLLDDVPGLAKADRIVDEQVAIPPEKHAKIAQALCRYLAESGVYSYNLRLRRVDNTEDPTVDFLLNVKEGHCERYAAGLTLMLRSLHIPARIVKGYHGFDSLENGRCLVKQNMAHAWTEALVPGEKAGTWVWLELDPTPDTTQSADSVMPVLMWVWARISNPQFLWKNMIMDYNQDRQIEARGHFRQAWDRLTTKGKEASAASNPWTMLRWPIVILALLATAGLGYWGRRFLFRAGRRPAVPPLDFYAHLLKVLAQRCHLQPATGQTPLEFGRLASRAIVDQGRDQPTPLPGRLTELPIQAAQLLYRVRFSGHEKLAEECAVLAGNVAELDAALQR